MKTQPVNTLSAKLKDLGLTSASHVVENWFSHHCKSVVWTALDGTVCTHDLHRYPHFRDEELGAQGDKG